MSIIHRNQVVAMLGPTNTGKTHHAIEKMLEHDSGVIGFPLRLLARENFDKLRQRLGDDQVALVTGEEKRVPRGARYFVCTVESMPIDRPFAFVAVDEIQLCADPERGHTFTARLLNMRGTVTTMFLGAETMRPLIERLAPEAAYLHRPRFSTLRWQGSTKLTRLPPRTAVIAFTLEQVYAIAEQLRQHCGGTAVVLGALSPRTRNAQVDLYQQGHVDYLVATDAIGMGLNLDVQHVAFASLRKFDGQNMRMLTPAELGQIAGRAGRHIQNGTFGVTGEAPSIDADIVEEIEQHRYAPLSSIFWRNDQLQFSTIAELQRGLRQTPKKSGLRLGQPLDDERTLGVLAQDPLIARVCTQGGASAVELLWQVCQIPDFRKLRADEHEQLLAQIFLLLIDHDGKLPDDFINKHIQRIDHIEGGVEDLMGRIAHIRIWTYIAHRAAWLHDPQYWQERTHVIEDQLSDALHARLTQRFVDRFANTLKKHKAQQPQNARSDGQNGISPNPFGTLLHNHSTNASTSTSMHSSGVGNQDSIKIDDAGVVSLGSLHLGKLIGFRLADDDVLSDEQRKLLAKTLRPHVVARIHQCCHDGDGAFSLSIPEHTHAHTQAQTQTQTSLPAAYIRWRGSPIARLIHNSVNKTHHVNKPQIQILTSAFIDGTDRDKLYKRLQEWFEVTKAEFERDWRLPEQIHDAAHTNHEVSGPVRGILYQLGENLGSQPRRKMRDLIDALDKKDRSFLWSRRILLGPLDVYCSNALTTKALTMRSALALSSLPEDIQQQAASLWPMPAGAAWYIPNQPNKQDKQERLDTRSSLLSVLQPAWYQAGYRFCDGILLRIDIIDQAARLLLQKQDLTMWLDTLCDDTAIKKRLLQGLQQALSSFFPTKNHTNTIKKPRVSPQIKASQGQEQQGQQRAKLG